MSLRLSFNTIIKLQIMKIVVSIAQTFQRLILKLMLVITLYEHTLTDAEKTSLSLGNWIPIEFTIAIAQSTVTINSMDLYLESTRYWSRG